MKKKSLQGLYAITDSTLLCDNPIEKVQLAIAGGINILQYRNKTASMDVQTQEAQELAQLCHQHDVMFLINDAVDLAIEVNADGVHLGQSDASLQDARKRLGDDKIIGVTCHNDLQLALEAEKNGADYIALGRFYPSLTKPNASAAKIELLHDAAQVLTIPIVAIGGIQHNNAKELLKQGADMIAVIHSLFGQSDILESTQEFVDIINQAKSH
ncbi:MAG: thiamine phosphate synthase [Woeseiaceae bacterium]